jgi:phage-related tail fiber protein
MAQPTADVPFNSRKITGLADPTQNQDAATKAYVDAVSQGIHTHTSARLATAAALPASTYSNGSSGINATITGTSNGALSVDGVAVAVDDRILVKNQANAFENGMYVVTATGGASAVFVLTRATDMNQDVEFPGSFEFVEEGTANADNGYVVTTNLPITIGTTAINWTQFSGAGQITAGAGLTKSGNTIDVATASTSRIVVNADSIDLATTGVSANTYKSVTVDTYGRVTAGTNPTTLAGYGIVDAQALDATLTALAGVSTSANTLIYATASDTFTTTSFTSFGRSLVDDADASAGRTTLGLGTMATQNANSVAITGGTIDGITFDGGSF